MAASLLYPRGFLLSRELSNPPADFVPGPVFENFFVDPRCAVDFAAEGDTTVVVLGTCVSTESPLKALSGSSTVLDEPTPATRMLSALQKNDEAFFDLIDEYCGRHVILFRHNGKLRILTDATGMRAVFYAAQGRIVASHARLVEEVLGGACAKNDFPFFYGFPGNHTPFPRTRLLTANTLYDFTQSKIVRFWPRKAIKVLSARKAADIVLKCTTNALQAMARKNSLSFSLTAGLDSRTTLAVGVYSAVQFDAYTYYRGPKTEIDCQVGLELARIAGIRHDIIDATNKPIPEKLGNALRNATYYNHHHSVIAPMREHFAEQNPLVVTANLLEIGRYFYKGENYRSIPAPDTPEWMCELYLRAIPPASHPRVARYGEERYKSSAVECFADFMRESHFNQARAILDPRDQFYWEHRMSAWHAMILLERDFYADCFIPFNSRQVFEALLGVSQKKRKNSDVFYRLIARCAPQLIKNIPINPRSWP